MTPDLKKNFVTRYLESLLERTRTDKGKHKWGLDWVVYQLGLARFGTPVRLPFKRTARDDYSSSKTEAEFGVDLSFLSEDKKTLTVFVLKAVELTNKTWVSKKFYGDLVAAQNPNLGSKQLAKVKQLVVILAYNKDDEHNGVTLFENFKKNAQPKVWKNKVGLEFDRWNLSVLVEQTLEHLLTPSLVPEKFFGQFSYLCAQVAEFEHGSDPWNNQLLPTWKRLLEDIIEEGSDGRGIALIPVVLIILHQHARENRTIATGLIDLTEWAAIALWRHASTSTDRKTQTAVFLFWTNFYVFPLNDFYAAEMPLLAKKYSLDQLAGTGFIAPLAASYIAYWHLARLGLLSMALAELLPENNETEALKKLRHELGKALHQVADWITKLVNANSCTYRPLLDIHHIEIFLIVVAWSRLGKTDVVSAFLHKLEAYLCVRRFGKIAELPFLDGLNSLENVFEQVARRPNENVVSTNSSFLVLMLMELCCALDGNECEELLRRIHAHLVLGRTDDADDEEAAREEERPRPLDLISWIPPVDWEAKVLRGFVDDGEAISLPSLSESAKTSGGELRKKLLGLIAQMSKASESKLKHRFPQSALILASLRHQSPLPPEIWRVGFDIKEAS